MIRRYLDKYKEFVCVAVECPDTCCSGWLIEIDENSLERFEKVSATDADFKSRINFEDGCFYQSKNKDCAFLLESGLCKMQKEHGEEMLCYTCDMYPRHVEEFPNVREYSLSASCPIVAKDLISKTDYISFTKEVDNEKDPDSADEYEDYNDLLYEKLILIRKKIATMLCGGGTFDKKADDILEVMGHIQEELDLGMYDGVEDAFDDDEYESCRNYEMDLLLYKQYISDLKLMRILEPLREDFVLWTNQAMEFLDKKVEENEDDFFGKYEAFEKEYESLDLIQCNVALYFIFTYFCGAVYDNYVYSAARLAIFSARVIKLLSFAVWLEKGTVDIDVIIYKFCRELEHSNDNINVIKQELDLAQ